MLFYTLQRQPSISLLNYISLRSPGPGLAVAGYQASAGVLVPGFGTGTMDAPPRIPIHQHGNSASHGQGAPLPGDLYLQYAEPSPPDTIDTGNYTTDQFEGPARKRQRLSGPSVTTAHHPSLPTGAPNNPFDVPANSGSSGRVTAVPIGVVPTGKSRRVRTGCLTCRDRHLKCDEGLPNCRNCEKGKRDCEYGIRLNFIETKVGDSPKEVSPTAEWSSALSPPPILLSLVFFLHTLGKLPGAFANHSVQSASRMSPES